ncbi:hypothetical protein BDZ89DRAFT_1163409 [Hymenopellis radicata]|nr:hypothetical protein BDZ89DRAFT_1163409 [Hymenopellis radicata]
MVAKAPSSRKASATPQSSPAPTANHPNTRSTRSTSLPPTKATPPPNPTSTAASRLRANRKDRVLDSIDSNASKIEKMLKDAPKTGQEASKPQAEESQSEGDVDEMLTRPEPGQEDPIITDFDKAVAEAFPNGVPPEEDDDDLSVVEEEDTREPAAEEYEQEEAPAVGKGKERARDPTPAKDAHDEQERSEEGETALTRQPESPVRTPFSTYKERLARKKEAEAKTANTGGSSVKKTAAAAAAAGGKKNDTPPADINPFAPNPYTADKEIEDVFSSSAPDLTPATPNRVTTHPEYAKVLDQSGGRIVEWNPPANIFRKNLSPSTVSFFGRLAMNDPCALVFISLGTKYRPEAVGLGIKEVRRLFSDFGIDMTDVEIHPFRSSLEPEIDYDEEDAKAIEGAAEGEDGDGMDVEETVVFQTVDWPRVKDEQLPAPGLMVTGLEQADYDFMLDMSIFIHRTGLSFGVLDVRNFIPTHHLTIKNLTLDDSAQDVAIGKEIIQNSLRNNPKFRNFVASHRDRLPVEYTDEQAIDVTINSVRYKPLYMGANASHYAGFKALGYIDPPFLNPLFFNPFVLITNRGQYKGRSGRGGIGALDYPFDCGRCSSTDHPTGHCFVNDLIKELNTKRAAARGANKNDEWKGARVTDDPFFGSAMDVDYPRARGTSGNRRRRGRAPGRSARLPMSERETSTNAGGNSALAEGRQMRSCS